MHGLPALLPGSSVMRSKGSMLEDTRSPDGSQASSEGCRRATGPSEGHSITGAARCR